MAADRLNRIAFVAPTDPHNQGAWSGMFYAARKALSTRFEVVDIVADNRHHPLDRGLARFHGKFGRSYLPSHGAVTSLKWGREVTTALRQAEVDAVVAVAASSAMAFASPKVPVVAVSDSTFPLVFESYPQYREIPNWAAQQAKLIERRSWQRSDVCVTTSQWAVESLVHDYRIARGKCRVVPFGPGIEPAGPIVQRRVHDPVRLLVVAKDWQRKRGDRALAVIDLLTQRGVRAHLTVVGATRPDGCSDRSNVSWLGSLMRDELGTVYDESDLLLELADANCASVTLTDARCRALPVIATDVGATSEIVRGGESGVLIPVGQDVSLCAAQAVERLSNPTDYAGFAAAACSLVAGRRDWTAWALAMEGIVRRLIAGAPE